MKSNNRVQLFCRAIIQIQTFGTQSHSSKDGQITPGHFLSCYYMNLHAETGFSGNVVYSSLSLLPATHDGWYRCELNCTGQTARPSPGPGPCWGGGCWWASPPPTRRPSGPTLPGPPSNTSATRILRYCHYSRLEFIGILILYDPQILKIFRPSGSWWVPRSSPP